MANSRASTSAGRKRTAKRSAAAKPSSRPRSGAHKPSGKRTAAPGAKRPAPPRSRPRTAAKRPGKPPAKPRTVRATSADGPGRNLSRALTVTLAVGVFVLALAAAYLVWFRDSSFVAIEKVTVEGISGPEAPQVEAALTKSAQGMSTLNVDEAELAESVSRYPTVVAIQADADFPHGLAIEVTGRPPVLTASDGGPPVPVAGDGTLLMGVRVEDAGLPAIQVESIPAKGGLTGEPLALAQAAGAAPEPLRPLIAELSIVSGEGLEITLQGGIPVKFGDPDALEAKWEAVAAVLANPQVKTLTHLDVRVPERPSIGGAAPALRGSGG